MDTIRIGQYIQKQRRTAGLTQKELAEKLGVSFQAVSKWETGESLPDTALILPLSEALNTTADRLLNGGALVLKERRLLSLDTVQEGFRCLEAVGECFGRDSSFYTGMIEGINEKMQFDLEAALKDPMLREVLYAEVLIQGILSGRTVDMEEIDASFKNRKMVDTIRRFQEKTEE